MGQRIIRFAWCLKREEREWCHEFEFFYQQKCYRLTFVDKKKIDKWDSINYCENLNDKIKQDLFLFLIFWKKKEGRKMLLTDGGRKILESIRGKTQKQGAFANARIPNQEKLEQVIEFRLTRRGRWSIHWEPLMSWSKIKKRTPNEKFDRPRVGLGSWLDVQILIWIGSKRGFSFVRFVGNSRLDLDSVESGKRLKWRRILVEGCGRSKKTRLKFVACLLLWVFVWVVGVFPPTLCASWWISKT